MATKVDNTTLSCYGSKGTGGVGSAPCQYVPGDVHVNTAEGLFSILKRGIIRLTEAVPVDGLVRGFLDAGPHPGDPKKVRKARKGRAKRP